MTGVEIDANEGNEENVIFFPDTVDKHIEANLKPLHGQISAFTEMMDRLI